MQSVVISESEVLNVLKLLQSLIAIDINGLSLMFNKFLQGENSKIIPFMSYQFFRGDNNLISFLSNSIKEGPKSDEDVRKIVYGFIADYICTYKENIGDYLPGIFDKMYSFFKI